jgi:hypothetical protein
VIPRGVETFHMDSSWLLADPDTWRFSLGEGPPVRSRLLAGKYWMAVHSSSCALNPLAVSSTNYSNSAVREDSRWLIWNVK